MLLAAGEAARRVIAGTTATTALMRARRVAQLAVAADSVAVANRALAMATDWAGQRAQFGVPIGSFQAVSHRCADMVVAAESVRNEVLSAADCDPDGLMRPPPRCGRQFGRVTGASKCLAIAR